MNVISISAVLISFLTQLSYSTRINNFIPKYCEPLKYNQNINKVTLSSRGNESILIIAAYLHEGLTIGPDFECYLIVEAPIGTGIVTSVKKASLHDNDTLTFESGSNPEKVWYKGTDEVKYQEIVSVPDYDKPSNVFLKFKPSTTQATHNAGFEIAFTAFINKRGDSCDENQFDCENERCISSDVLCDGYNNCGNNQDESGCAGVSIWIIILLIAIGIVVVILAIFVWYKMAQKRQHFRDKSNETDRYFRPNNIGLEIRY